jgi:hypothetical protein
LVVFITAVPSHLLLKHPPCYIKIGRGKEKGLHVSDDFDDFRHVSCDYYHPKAIGMITQHVDATLDALPAEERLGSRSGYEI